jgi:hypothetical protein
MLNIEHALTLYTDEYNSTGIEPDVNKWINEIPEKDQNEFKSSCAVISFLKEFAV